MTEPAPGPGAYPGVPFDVYTSWPYVNNSKIGGGLVSMRFMYALMTGAADTHKDTPAFKLGRAGHTAILEPDDFPRRYIVQPDTFTNSKDEVKPLNRRSKEGAARLDELARQHEIMDGADYDRCLAMRNAVQSHRSAAAIIGADGDVELSIAWDDADTGVRCKARIDKLLPHVLADLKTTISASPDGFVRSFAKYHYHRQIAFYLDGLAAIRGDDHIPEIVAVENHPPFGVCVFAPDAESIAIGRDEYKRVLAAWAVACVDRHYPGYPEDIQPLALPAWAVPREDDE